MMLYPGHTPWRAHVETYDTLLTYTARTPWDAWIMMWGFIGAYESTYGIR